MTSIHGRISRDGASHYTWGDGCDGWHLVSSTAMSVIEERMPPGTAEVRHRHRRARQFFYLLAGHLDVEVEGVHHRLAAREGLEIPPGAAHQVRNEGAEAAEFLVVSTPPARADREAAGTGSS